MRVIIYPSILVKQAGKDASYMGVLVIGFGITGMVETNGYTIVHLWRVVTFATSYKLFNHSESNLKIFHCIGKLNTELMICSFSLFYIVILYLIKITSYY